MFYHYSTCICESDKEEQVPRTRVCLSSSWRMCRFIEKLVRDRYTGALRECHVRNPPLGEDRFNREYYRYQGDPGRLYVFVWSTLIPLFLGFFEEWMDGVRQHRFPDGAGAVAEPILLSQWEASLWENHWYHGGIQARYGPRILLFYCSIVVVVKESSYSSSSPDNEGIWRDSLSYWETLSAHQEPSGLQVYLLLSYEYNVEWWRCFKSHNKRSNHLRFSPQVYLLPSCDRLSIESEYISIPYSNLIYSPRTLTPEIYSILPYHSIASDYLKFVVVDPFSESSMIKQENDSILVKQENDQKESPLTVSQLQRCSICGAYLEPDLYHCSSCHLNFKCQDERRFQQHEQDCRESKEAQSICQYSGMLFSLG